jgi:cytochrome P450
MSSAAKLKFPPGPSTGLRRWSLGPLNNGDPLGYFTGLMREYGDLVSLRVLNFRILLLNHPDYIEDVLVNHPRKFIKGRVLKANKRVFGSGLLTSEGDFWLRQRRLAQPAFHRARIAGYASTMVEYTERLLHEWQDGEERDIHKEMMRLTLQIVGKTLFDADVEGDAQDVGKSMELLLELAADFRRTVLIPHWLPTPANFRLELAIRKIEKVLYRIIAEKRASGRNAGDLLSMLLAAQDEDGSRMTDQQLRDEAITLFLAGHETTANTLSWTWWLLAQNPAVEAKLHAELRSVLGGRTPSLDDLPKLVYTNHIITESMRLYPPAWGTARTAVDDHEIAGYSVPKGSGVSFAQWTVHRDARWYDAPEEFRPERWEGDLLKRIPRFAYFPFGGGPRQCIGNSFALMEAALVLATIAQQYRFRLVEGHPVVPLASITLRPRHGIRAVLEARPAKSRVASDANIRTGGRDSNWPGRSRKI